MALSQSARMALLVAFFGVLAFVFGVVAENKKPPYGTAIKGKDVVICKYPTDPTVVLGVLSVVSLFITAGAGLLSVFYPYKGKMVPPGALLESATLAVFSAIAVFVTVLAEGMMMWATITEGLHRLRNIHHNMDTNCPTAKTGLFGGAAFLALDATLFWLVCQMLALNAKADHLDEDDPNGEYGEVATADNDNNGGTKAVV